ncbi:MAG: hypothetical protein M1833_005905 [Piccolia ochrophora]|nr:MAG: hypothetical protein M1833_005905 [Piccolia ochrophora]
MHKMSRGRWPKDPKMKDISTWFVLNTLDRLEAFSLATFTRLLDWSVEEVQLLIAKARADSRSSGLHTYLKL